MTESEIELSLHGGQGKTMKLDKVVAILAIALAAGISLAACGSSKAPAVVSAATHTVTVAPAATPKASATAAPPKATSAPTTPAAAPAKTVYVPAAPAQPAYFTNSTAVVQQFYQDINNGDYSAAWALGGDNISGSNEAEWAAGYDTTVSVSLGTFSALGSDQVQASLSALQSDGTTDTYEGTYTVSGGVIVAANIVQTG
jgi:hypothetical protein